ncbi:MAG: NAD(+)/NADH kinase [Candidatus Heimdallarchaeota archaeon]|nr:NAD(+)/NADH kinase [Candidatus Heimdallarchaeota archaeon]MDH5646890.1 NAD(+)/NADH kinase [Candidatus Heimdallarchaeota archaeon]
MSKEILIGYIKGDDISIDKFRLFIELAQKRGFSVFQSPDSPILEGIDQITKFPDNAILIVFGGDGTMLRAVKNHPNVPIIGINCGSFGFLCEFEHAELEEVFTFIENKNWIEDRSNQIEGRVNGNTYTGINECVISGANTGKPIDFRVTIEDIPMFQCRADGIIFSTPNGSTAYNFAAGGAILSPTLSAIIITPIAPFLSLDRPIIVNPEKSLKLENLETSKECRVFYDGIMQHTLKPGDQLKITSSSHQTVFLRRKGSFSRRVFLKFSERYSLG